MDYLMRKGGLVRNVDLVRHFKKYLQFESEREKGKFVANPAGHGFILLPSCEANNSLNYNGMFQCLRLGSRPRLV